MQSNSFLRYTVRLFLAAVVAFPILAGAQAAPGDAAIQADVQKQISPKRFQKVTASVAGGVVSMSGSVELYADKGDLERRVHKVKNVKDIRDAVVVDGPVVEDSTLRAKLSEKITYDRVGYGTTTFNAFTLGVQNGVVTLGGIAYGPTDKASAIALVESYPGVKDVVDHIQVAPPSSIDDRIRQDEARAIYGAAQLNRYALDPGKPIRITVINGNVTLSGVVDSAGDRDVANIRANTVPGVFKVVNNLQVAGQSSGR